MTRAGEVEALLATIEVAKLAGTMQLIWTQQPGRDAAARDGSDGG